MPPMREFTAVVLGAGGTGKSALTMRFMQDIFLDYYNPTIEEVYHRVVEVDGIRSSLEVLDTAGAEQFTALLEMYITSGRGFILVFSLTQEESLREVENLRQQIYRIKSGEPNIPIVVVGTKSDLTSEREVRREMVHQLATRWALPFYETSAKKDWFVTDVFHDLVRQMRVRYPDRAGGRPSGNKKDRKKCIVM